MAPRNFLPHATSEIEIRRVRAIPALDAFTAAVDETLASDGEGAFWRCEPFFKALCRSRFERDLINYELERMKDDGDYTPLGSTGRKLTIVSGRRYRLLLALNHPVDAPETKYSTLSEHRMLGVLGPGRVGARLYQQPPDVRNEVFDPAAALLPNGDLELGPGDMTILTAGRDVIGARHCDAPTLTVLFGSDVRQTLLWEYDPATLLPVRALAVETSSSRLQYAARLFTEIGGAPTMPGLRRLFEHRDHFVRWTALQSMIAIDPVEGTARLRQALHDPHPHVRNAAARSLTKLAARANSLVATTTE